MHPALANEMIRAWQRREQRTDIRLAMLRLTVAQAAGAKRHGGGALTIDDFLPGLRGAAPELTPEEKERKLQMQFQRMAQQSAQP